MGHETDNKSMTNGSKSLHKPALLAFIAVFSLNCHSNVRFRLMPVRDCIFSAPLQGPGPFVMHPKNQNVDVHCRPDKATGNEPAEDSSNDESGLIHSLFYE
jgi:hypothetical protein